MVTQRLRDLRDELGSDSFDEVIALFLEETDEMADKLRARASPQTLSADLHFLKGAALNLGFDTLAEACDDATLTARKGHAGAVDINAILRIYAEEKAILVGSGLTEFQLISVSQSHGPTSLHPVGS